MRTAAPGLSEYEEMAATLRQATLFSGLDETQLEAFTQEARLIVLLKDRILFHAGDTPRHFYILASGCIQLYKPETDKDPKVIGIARAGESICDASAILGSAYAASAQATLDSKLIAIPRACMMRLLAEGGPITIRMLETLSKHALDTQQKLLEMNGHSGVRRVACYLLHFSPRLDSPSYEMTLPASKAAVASHLNMTKETFSRALRDLREAGIIEVNSRTISILDTERLRGLRP